MKKLILIGFGFFFFLFGNIKMLGQEQDTTLSIEERWKRGEDALFASRIVEAIPDLEICFEHYVEENDFMRIVNASQYLSYCYETTSLFKKAVDVTNTAIQMIERRLIEIKQSIGLEESESANSSITFKELGERLEKAGKPANAKEWDQCIKIGLFYTGLGYYYSMMGETEQALKYAQTGVQINRENDFPRYLANSLGALGGIYLNVGKYEEATMACKEAIEIYEAFGQKIPSNLMAIPYLNWGLALTQLKQFHKAVPTLEKSIALLKESGAVGLQHIGYAYESLGKIYSLWGELDKGLEYYEKNLHVLDQLNIDKGLIVASAHQNLGQVYASKGQHDKAIEYFEKALPLFPEDMLKDGNVTAAFYAAMCTSYGTIGNFERAIEFGNLANNMFGRLSLEEDRVNIKLLIDLGGLHTAQLDHKKAAEYLRKAELLLQEKSGKNAGLWAMLYRKKGKSSYEQKNYDSAFDFYEMAVLKVCPQIMDQDVEQIQCNAQFESLDEFWALYDYTSLLLEQKTSDESLRKGVKICLAGITFFEKRNRNLKLNNREDLYLPLMKLNQKGQQIALSLYRQRNQSKDLETAFFFADYQKALTVQKALKDAEAVAYANIPDSLLKKRRVIERDLSYYEKQLVDAQDKGDAELVRQIKNDKIFEVNRQLESTSQLIAQYSNLTTYQKPNQKREQLTAFQKMLDGNSLFVEYSIQSEDQVLDIFTVTSNDGIHITSIPFQTEIEQTILKFNKLIQSPSLFRRDKREQFIQLSHLLYKQFISPIEGFLSGKNKLILVGDGVTHYLPFEVLLKKDDIKAFHELEYLISDMEISYHYSANLYAISKEQVNVSAEGQQLFAFAPVFEEEGSNKLLAANMDLFRDSTLRAFTEDGNYSPLPYSELELLNIQKLFSSSGKESTLLLYEQANEASLKSNLEKGYDYVHIATHSFANIDQPKFSGIACTHPSKDEHEDGTLFVGEIYNLNVQADLIVLSSCESGIGKLAIGEGLLGLNRSFVYAGVPNVVFSLWKVNDKTTSGFMVNFYDHLLKGESYGSALRLAKLELLKNKLTASPNLWSGFLLVGR